MKYDSSGPWTRSGVMDSVVSFIPRRVAQVVPCRVRELSRPTAGGFVLDGVAAEFARLFFSLTNFAHEGLERVDVLLRLREARILLA